MSRVEEQIRRKKNRALLSAIEANNELSIITLLKNGANVNCCEQKNYSPLHLAVNEKNTRIVKILLSFGARLDAKNQKGISPFHLACIHGKLEIANLLIESGADINSQDDGGNTPISNIICAGPLNVIIFLLKKGADVFVPTRINDLPLHIACEYKRTKIVKMLLKIKGGEQVNRPGFVGQFPLHYAVQAGSLEIVKILLNFGAKIDCLDDSGRTPLNHAIKSKNSDIAIFLVKNGADVNFAKEENYSPIHVAVKNEDKKAVQIFLHYGADVNVVFGNGKTPLEKSLEKNNIFVTELLKTHVVKLKFMKMFVNPKNLDAVFGESDKVVEKFTAECEKKLQMLEEKFVDDYSVTLKCILMNSTGEIIILLRNNEIRKKVKKMDLKKKFGMFANFAENKVKVALEKAEMFALCHEVVRRVVLPVELPVLCISEIIGYLNEDEMKMIVLKYLDEGGDSFNILRKMRVLVDWLRKCCIKNNVE